MIKLPDFKAITMDKKTIIIFALAGIAVIFLFMILGSNRQINGLKQERSRLNEVNSNLNARLNNVLETGRKLEEANKQLEIKNEQFEERLSSLNKDLENIYSQKTILQQKYDSLGQEKENLMNEINKLRSQLDKKETPSKVPEISPQTPADTYWAGLLKEKITLELELSKLRDELNALKMGNEQLEQGKRATDLEFDSLVRDNQDFKRELEYNKKLLDSLTQELIREKNYKYQIQEDLKTMKAENKLLRQQLKTTDERKILLEAKLADLQSKNTVLENSLAKMETFIREKIIQMDSLKEELGLMEKPSVETRGRAQVSEKTEAAEKESVELQPIIVRPQGAEPKAKTEISAQKGNILAVNKENNFVIINLGENAGIKPGDNFRVYNEKEEIIGNIVVVQVRKGISACDINQENFPLKVGDTVRQIPNF